MREILTLQLGKSSNRIGTAFWETVCQEHRIDVNGVYTGHSSAQLEKIAVYFEEAKGKFTPRTVLVDLETGIEESVRACEYGKIFHEENFVTGCTGVGNNWAKGYYTEGAELSDEVLDVVRKKTEKCHSLGGFQMFHTLADGTVSGMGAHLLYKLKEEYPDKTLSTFSLFPSPMAADAIVDPYNAVLTANEMLQHADVTFCSDNEALYRIWFKTLKLTRSPEYEDLNHFIALALSGVTSSFRFPSQLNVDMDNLIGNMVPEPTLHFLMPVFAPLFPRGSKSYPGSTLTEITQALYDPGHAMTSCNPRKGRYITLSTIYRGKVGAKDVTSELLKVRHELDKNFVEWFPHNIKTDTLCIPTYGSEKSSTLISNSTSIQEVFKRLLEQFDSLFRRKAFLHWYTEAGMEVKEFIDAEENLRKLVAEYQKYQGECVEEEKPEVAENDDAKPEAAEASIEAAPEI